MPEASSVTIEDISSMSLDDISFLLLWTAIAIYALAFVAYAVDLARRSEAYAVTQDATQGARAKTLVGVSAGSSSGGRDTIEQIRADEAAAEREVSSPISQRPKLFWARLGTVLTVLAFLFHLIATVLRGIAAERVPWANMYEFAMTGCLLVVAVYLAVLVRYDLRFVGTFITGLIVVMLGGATMSFYVVVVPLMDPLKSIWLIIHVFVASLSTAFLALAFALSVLQLLQARRESKAIARAATAKNMGGAAGSVSTRARRDALRFLRTVPSAEALEGLAYRFAIIGFIFWTFTLIAGAIWAQESWGRYWGFDVKEVWTFIIWVVYAGYIHARATRGWRGNRSAWLSIIGFLTVLFNFVVVNQYFKGLHAYSGL